VYKMGIWSPETLPAPLVILREQRDHLLLVSDWTQAADSPLSDAKKAEWATYRQALRDLPSNYAELNDYDDVVWPTRPE
jgi:hypothetical protein